MKPGCKKAIYITAAAVGMALSLNACRGLELENKTEMVEEYTEPQAMILIANARNRYENVYTDAVWQLVVSTDGSTFDKLIVQDVREYLEQIKLILLLADEEGVSLSSGEREAIRQMTESYYEGLSAGDLSYIGCGISDVQTMYTDIALADKLLKTLTESVDEDLSDSEAKVIKISQIVTSDERKALAILKRIKIDGQNFTSMAGRYTEADEIELTLLKGDDDEDLFTRTAFSLEEGDVSNILCIDGLYYIIKCDDDYAEEETLSRKESIISVINTKAVQDILSPYAAEHNIRFTERFWDGIDFSEPSGSAADNFFDIYDMFAAG